MDEKTQLDTQETVQELEQPTSAAPIIETMKSRKKAAIFTISIVALAILGLVGYLVLFSTDQTSDTAVQQPMNNEAPSAVVSNSNVPEFLLESSQGSNGIAVGYLKKNEPATSRSFLVPKASAAEVEYEPIVFYSNLDNIFSLNTVTKESKQVTDTIGSNPVFSSIAQKLAFNKERCDVFVKDMSTNEDVLVVDGDDAFGAQGEDGSVSISSDAICYTPAAWSPDANKLAIKGTYSVNSTEMGLVGFIDMYIYDFASFSLTKIEPPEGFNTSQEFRWLNNEKVLVKYAEFGAFASLIKEQITETVVEDNSHNPTNLSSTLSLENMRTVGKTSVAVSEGMLLQSDTGAIADFKPILAVNILGNYLIKGNATGDAIDSLYTLDGMPGSQGSFKIQEVKINETRTIDLYSPDGFSAYLLGWGLNYDEIIYMAVLSGKSEVHQYTISTGTNEVLVPDLPLQ